MTPSAGLAVAAQNNAGANLLHVAVCAGVHESVLMKLLKLGPRAVEVPDNHGLLPIHFVAAFGTTSWPVAAEMIRLYPDCIRYKSESGDTPLHLLVSNSLSFLQSDDDAHVRENVLKVAEWLIEGVVEEDDSDSACSGDEAVSPVLIRNNDDINPLHAAALFNAPVKLTQLLMTSSDGPGAAAEKTSFGGSTPLHLACASKHVSHPSVSKNVNTLTTRKACATTDNIGRTPLAVAAANRKVTKRVISDLAETYPQAAAQTTLIKGQLPLHLAVASRKSKASVVKAIIDAYPDALKARTARGNTPLHEACKYRAPTAVVEVLIDSYPEALGLENNCHELPIDRARASGASRDVITLLQGSSYVMERIEGRFLPAF